MLAAAQGQVASQRRVRSAYLVNLAITNAVGAGEAGSEGGSEGRRADGAPGGGGHEGRSRASEVLDAATVERRRLVSSVQLRSAVEASSRRRQQAPRGRRPAHSSIGLNWARDGPRDSKTAKGIPLEHLDRYLRTTSDGGGGGCLVGLREEIETFRENLGSTATSSLLEQSS